MARRPSLDMALAAPPAAASSPPPPLAAPLPAIPRARTPGRQGKRGVAFWLNPMAFRQLSICSAEEDRTVQSLMEEAVDMLFQSRGKHRLASNGEGSSNGQG